jgi:hypothetical protein
VPCTVAGEVEGAESTCCEGDGTGEGVTEVSIVEEAREGWAETERGAGTTAGGGGGGGGA